MLKKYAKSDNISLSRLIESNLTTLTTRKTPSPEITPLVESLSGVIAIDKDFDAKDAYADYLIEKYK